MKTHTFSFRILTEKATSFTEKLGSRFLGRYSVLEQYPIRGGMLNVSVVFWH